MERNLVFLISNFHDPHHQRQIETGLNIEFCNLHDGQLVYENDQPFLWKDQILKPLAITHTRGLHIIGIGKYGIDVENKDRKILLKPEWIPSKLIKLPMLDVFILGESIIKLNISKFSQLLSELKILKVSKENFNSELGHCYLEIKSKLFKHFICSHFYLYQDYSICISRIL